MRRHRRLQQGHVDPDLPITPMLDMSFQLLAFFILTFQPGKTEGQLNMMLPAAGASAPTTITEPLELDEEKPLVIRVEATVNNMPTKFIVLESGDTEGEKYPAGDQNKMFALLTDRNKAKKAEAKKLNKKSQTKLTFEFAKQLRYQFVMNLMDKAKEAGFDSITPGTLGEPKP